MPDTTTFGKFELGRGVATRGADAHAREILTAQFGTANIDKMVSAAFNRLILRHVSGDWGDMPPEDHKANDDALRFDQRIVSKYDLFGRDVYVITEWDRSLTTILLCEEY